MGKFKTVRRVLKIKSKCKKRTYKDKKQAKTAIKNNKQCKKSLYKYECKDCGGWHLTSLSPKKYKCKIAASKLMRYLESSLNNQQRGKDNER